MTSGERMGLQQPQNGVSSSQDVHELQTSSSKSHTADEGREPFPIEPTARQHQGHADVISDEDVEPVTSRQASVAIDMNQTSMVSLGSLSQAQAQAQQAARRTSAPPGHHQSQEALAGSTVRAQRTLRRSSYRHPVLFLLAKSIWAIMIRPCRRSFHWAYSLMHPITPEEVAAKRRNTALAAFALLLTIIFAPLLLVGLPLFALTQIGRRPFSYHQYYERKKPPVSKMEWSICSGNLTLLPEATARGKFNLAHTRERARKIGSRIGACSAFSHDVECSRHRYLSFPSTDVLCLQGVQDHIAESRMRLYLQQYYPYVLSDGGNATIRSFRFVRASGLMIFSKYPVMDARFVPFPNNAGIEKRTSRGILMAKLRLTRQHRGNKRIVAYVFNTHLHRAKRGATHKRQLDCLEKETRRFREKTFDDENEVIGFQTITGEFNFDNVTETSKHGWHHSLFERYIDPFALAPGKDQEWSLPTKLKVAAVQEYEPTSLAKELVSERVGDIVEGVGEPVVYDVHSRRFRRDHYFDDDDTEVEVVKFETGLKRTQRVMLEHPIGLQLPLSVRNCGVVTALAGLCVDLPVAVQFTIGEREHIAQETHHGPISDHRDPTMPESSLPTRYSSHSSLQSSDDDQGFGAVGIGQVYGGVILIEDTNEAIQIDEYDLDSASESEDEDEKEVEFVDVSEI